ncbi:hypothetical protein CSV74_12830 [Sporosarcina sp. P19]|nr:hypothetical protein CSV74_12830 [Sporosarcina sp. P19]
MLKKVVKYWLTTCLVFLVLVTIMQWLFDPEITWIRNIKVAVISYSFLIAIDLMIKLSTKVKKICLAVKCFGALTEPLLHTKRASLLNNLL